jgi:RNA polymerase sigma factor (TIGR02999 family)
LTGRRKDHLELQQVSDEITRLLARWKAGDADAGDEVVVKTYRELRRIAHAHLRRERRGHTLQTTALLHEAYVRLLRKGPGSVENREAFFRLMAAEMRRRLVDYARRRLADKRGGGVIHEPLEASALVASLEDADEVEAMLGRLDRALDELNGSYPRAARVVQLRFIAGLTTDETAQAIGLSPGTVKREWTFARAWLAAALESDHLAK